MAQHLDLYNLDNSVNVPNSVGGKFGASYSSVMDKGTQVMRALWSPDENEKRVLVLPLNRTEGLSFPQESNDNLSKGLLNQLSNEVVGTIIGKILDISDLISLMVTCQRYWESGRRHLERLIEDFIVVSWAGDRLISLGDHTVLDHLLKGILMDSETECLAQLFDEYHLYAIRSVQKPRYNISSRRMSSISSTHEFLIHAVPHYAYELQGMERLLKRLILITDLDPVDFFSGNMVFRNLTTKEYVRGDAMTKLWGIGFQHVLYIRTTWPSSLNWFCHGSLKVHRGVWAGHRFDVKRIGSVSDEEGVSVDSWKDVTTEVVDEMIGVLM